MLSDQRETLPQTQDTGDSTLGRIREHYASLPPSERKLADLILDFPGDIAAYSATELTRLAGVSKATASRLFQRLGYESYEQARLSARRESDWGSPLYKLTQLPHADGKGGYLQQLAEQHMLNMLHTFETLDLEKLDGIGRRLARARSVWLLGVRHGQHFAGYAAWQFLQVRDQVHLLSCDQPENISGLDKQDVLVAIGFRRRTTRFLSMLKLIHGRGIPILYLTDPSVGASINYASWVLQAVVSRTHPFDSYPAASSLIHMLSVATLRHAGAGARERVKQIEELHNRLHDFRG